MFILSYNLFFSKIQLFLVAPLVGGVLAALVYKFLDSKKAE